jgi:hypothetical protein
MSSYPQNANPILVPIGLDALVVGSQNNTQDFNGFTLDWCGIAQGTTTPSPPSSTPPIPGVNLHWSLPDGIARGVVADRT